MTCSPEANQITASKILKWSLRTISLSVYLSLSLAHSLSSIPYLLWPFSIIFHNYFFLKLFVPSFLSLNLLYLYLLFVFLFYHPSWIFFCSRSIFSLCVALVLWCGSLKCCLSCTHKQTHTAVAGLGLDYRPIRGSVFDYWRCDLECTVQWDKKRLSFLLKYSSNHLKLAQYLVKNKAIKHWFVRRRAQCFVLPVRGSDGLSEQSLVFAS